MPSLWCFALKVCGLSLLYGSPAVVLAYGVFEAMGDVAGEPFHSEALAFSGDGYYIFGRGDTEAFQWLPGIGMVVLASPGRGSNVAVDADGDGDWVVGSSASGETSMAIAWHRGSLPIALGDLPGGPSWSQATAVSGDGRLVVGQGTDVRGSFAFLYQKDAGLTLLGTPGLDWLSSIPNDLSADGQVAVGECLTLSGTRAFIWRPSTGFRLLRNAPGSVGAGALATSSDGSIVVGHSELGEGTWPTIWVNGVPSLLPPIDEEQTDGEAVDVSADGTYVVGNAMTPGGQEAWIYVRGEGIFRVEDYVQSFEIRVPSGWALTKANAVVKNGNMLVIAGAGSNIFAYEEAWVAWMRKPPIADLNGDGRVNVDDFFVLAASYEVPPGQPGFDPRADIDRDSIVDVNDFLTLASMYRD